MDYANLAGFAIAGTGGLILGKAFGCKLAGDGMRALKVIEARLASIESMFTGEGGQAAATSARAAEKYNGAIAKLAVAIEKHAAAIDDHGAATVAAAVETYAAMHPSANAVAVRSA